MSGLQGNCRNWIRSRGDDEQLHQPSSSSSAQSAATDQSGESAGFPDPSASTRSDAADPSTDAQPLAEQVTKKPRRSPLLVNPLDQLATVELQLVLQFLDPDSKLKAARCSRPLLQAADHPFAWHGPSVAVSSDGQPQLGTLISQSLLRHASIALTLNSELPPEEVAAVPNLRSLTVPRDRCLHPSLLALPALQRLQTLHLHREPVSTLRLLASLPALHTLECWVPDDCGDCSGLPAIPALTDLRLTCILFESDPQRALDAIVQCAQLRSLRLRCPGWEVSAFARRCSSPTLRQLRHLVLKEMRARDDESSAEECRAAFSALDQLESLCLERVNGVDLLLPHLIHAPALRILCIACRVNTPGIANAQKSTLPSREALRQLLAAAPRLHVRLQTPSLETWRIGMLYFCYEDPAQTERMDAQWRELQRMGAEMERVTAVEDNE